MPFSEMLGRVALIRTNISEELNASIIRVTKIGELGTTSAATSNISTLADYYSPDDGGHKSLRNLSY
jgi:hypothetical protein